MIHLTRASIGVQDNLTRVAPCSPSESCAADLVEGRQTERERERERDRKRPRCCLLRTGEQGLFEDRVNQERRAGGDERRVCGMTNQ